MIGWLPENAHPWIAEATTAAGSIVLLAMSRVGSLERKAGDVALLVVAMSALASVIALDAPQGYVLERVTVADPFAGFFRFVLAMCALATTWLSTRSREGTGPAAALSWSLLLVALLGMDLMVSSISILSAWCGFAISGLASALWIASRHEGSGGEHPALPLLVQSAIGCALLLAGFTLLFALTGASDFPGIGSHRSVALAAPGGAAVWYVAAVLVLAALGQRIGAAPLHAWRVDAAGTSSIAAAAWLEIASSIAALALLTRVLRFALCSGVSPEGAWAVSPLERWPDLLSVLAMLAMVVGNFGALRAADLRRMTAYLATAQAGALLMGLVSLSDDALRACLFHAVAFALSLAGMLAVLAPVVEQAGSSDFEALRGLARRRGGARWSAAALACFVLSLAAVPPFGGFSGKVALITAAYGGGRSVLVAASALASVLALLLGVRILATLLDRPADPDEPVHVDFEAALLAGLLLAGTIVIGMLPEALASFASRSVVFFGG
ncbi:MAG TPA: proton-conducting transporter membrane subunit [Candidatus Binatia bacterium]